jgi:deoxyribodipyrimidine photolyase
VLLHSKNGQTSSNFSCLLFGGVEPLFDRPKLLMQQRDAQSTWTVVSLLLAEIVSEGLMCCRRYEPAMEQTDARVTGALQEAGYEVRSYSGLLLREPADVRLDMGSGRWVGHFGTLSPFLKCDSPLPRMQHTRQACCLSSWLRSSKYELHLGPWSHHRHLGRWSALLPFGASLTHDLMMSPVCSCCYE